MATEKQQRRSGAEDANEAVAATSPAEAAALAATADRDEPSTDRCADCGSKRIVATTDGKVSTAVSFCAVHRPANVPLNEDA